MQFSCNKKSVVGRAGALSVVASVVAAASLAVAVILCLFCFNIAFHWSQAKVLKPVSDKPETEMNEAEQFPVVINQPTGKLGVFTGTHPHGEDFKVACSTCHAGRQPNFENRVSGDLKEFHNQAIVAHGEISCLSCHNPDDYDSFRLADGTQVEYANVMQLCAQCHGPQMRDYENGVHGGMTGHWDRTKGPQQKLNCIDCHFAHQPKFPQMQPDFKPRDRFLAPSHQTHSEGGQH